MSMQCPSVVVKMTSAKLILAIQLYAVLAFNKRSYFCRVYLHRKKNVNQILN